MSQELMTLRSIFREVCWSRTLEISERRTTAQLTSHRLLEIGSFRLWYCVPELGSAKVDVIDAIKIHVFDVPGKRCPPHAEVEVWGVDSGQTLVRGWEEAIKR